MPRPSLLGLLKTGPPNPPLRHQAGLSAPGVLLPSFTALPQGEAGTPCPRPAPVGVSQLKRADLTEQITTPRGLLIVFTPKPGPI